MNRTTNSVRIRRLVYSAVLLAVALVLPFLTGQIPQIGSMLSPMHIPVLLCGFLCGWPWGMVVGFAAPILRFVLFGMPKLYPTAIAMMFELAAYGAFAGILYRVLPRKPWSTYVTLIASMILGRLVWGIAQFFLLAAQGSRFTLAMFLAGAFTKAVPGIVLHIVLIPILVMLLQKGNLILNERAGESRT